jgi:hypothetical protein
MAVVMNSILCAGCMLFIPTNSNIRLCLRELHILSSTDYKSMILVVFNKYTPSVPPLT